MNREQKGAVIAEIAADIAASETIFAVDYRGITVLGAAELRAKLRDADATFRVVKNSLTERAAAEAEREDLKPLLVGPTALAFVRGDAALAAKAIADYGRLTQLLAFKGGLMGAEALAPEQILAISRLPSRQVLYGQMVGLVASPVSGLVRTLGALVGGLAVALGEVKRKRESGELPEGASKAAAGSEDEPEAKADVETEAKADVETEAKAGAETEAKAGAETEAKAGAETEAKAGAETEARADDETDTTARAETDAGPEGDAAATPQAQTDNDVEGVAAGQAATAEATKED